MIVLLCLFIVPSLGYMAVNGKSKNFDDIGYLEEQYSILYGVDTPIYTAQTLNLTDNAMQDKYASNIVFEEYFYPNKKLKLTSYSYFLESGLAEKKVKEKIKKGKKQNIVYPEILVVIDYDTYVAYNKDVKEIASYMGSFWHAVDLRFRSFKKPKIRLNIAGLVITMDRQAEPYLIRDSSDGKYFKDLTLTGYNISEYFQKKFPFSITFDLVVMMTRRPLEKRITATYGYAFQNGVCKHPYSVALVTDSGGFEGILTAAHELAHLFGAPHDSQDLKIIAGDLCSSPDGYLMKDSIMPSENANAMHWSDCSKRAIQDNLRRAYSECVRNKPKVLLPHLKKLPGKIFNRNQQCGKIFPGFESEDNNSCVMLECKKCLILGMFCEYLTHWRPPAEGTSCGYDSFCLDGKCVKDPGFYN